MCDDAKHYGDGDDGRGMIVNGTAQLLQRKEGEYHLCLL
jgi:hypothetical protein